MFFVRGDPRDYDQWSDDYNCKGWSYKEVLPYFKKIESPQFETNDENKAFRGSNGPQAISFKNPTPETSNLFIKACENKGFKYNADYNGACQDGVCHTQFNTLNGRRMTSFRSYIAPLYKRWTKSTDFNIDILPYSQVSKLVTNGKRVTAVELIYKNDVNNKKIIKSKEEVVLSAGAIGSPHILLLSGIGPKEQLDAQNIECVADIPGIGKNLQDHMLSGIRLRVPKSLPLLTEKEGRAISTVMEYFFKGSGWLTSMTCDAQLFCKSESGKRLGIKANDLQLVACPGADEQGPSDRRNKYSVDCDENAPKTSKDDPDYWSLMGLIFPLHPTTVGDITLKSADPMEYPIINYDYLQTQYDKDCYVDGILLLKDIFTDKVFTDLGCSMVIDQEFKQTFESDEQFWSREAVLDRLQKRALTCYHPIGTCKMGNIDTDEMAVCDERLRVRGFENLRVMDASIMPALPSGNTQAPCYMIGEKGADMIIHDSKKKNV